MAINKKNKPRSTKILNKKAKHTFELLDRFETGVVLTGAEVKSAKLGHVSLAESYVRIINGEVWLINANINPYFYADQEGYDPRRTRKLLLHKHEILKIYKKMEGTNLTIVPTALYCKKGYVKVEIALARGKKQYEKREKKKRRDLDREQERVLKRYR